MNDGDMFLYICVAFAVAGLAIATCLHPKEVLIVFIPFMIWRTEALTGKALLDAAGQFLIFATWLAMGLFVVGYVAALFVGIPFVLLQAAFVVAIVYGFSVWSKEPAKDVKPD